RGTLVRVRKVVRPTCGGGQGLSPHRNGRQAVTGRHVRFTGWQRVLHWLMAACILAMLFIGVGMVSTIRPIYLTLVSIHKPLGTAILILALIRLALRLRYGAPSLPADLPEPMKLAAVRISRDFIQTVASSSASAAERQRAYAVVGRALLSRLC